MDIHFHQSRALRKKNWGSLKNSALRLPRLPLYKQAFIYASYRLFNLTQKYFAGEHLGYEKSEEW